MAGGRFRQVKAGPRTTCPLQVVQIDHTKVDLELVGDISRACIGRPWLTLVLDVHTRMIIGLQLSLTRQVPRALPWPSRMRCCPRQRD